MPKECNDQGRAFECACFEVFSSRLAEIREGAVVPRRDSSYNAALRAWNNCPDIQEDLLKAADVAVDCILETEPLIAEGRDNLVVHLQSDSNGVDGDVRDLIIERKNISWEIGLSLKHNHFAVKHSRLSQSIDFGERWYGVPCSDTYWENVTPVFDYLKQERAMGTRWSQLTDKDVVYKTLLDAFMEEIYTAHQTSQKMARSLVEYLLGYYDFYKVIAVDYDRATEVYPFNIRGSLNKNGRMTRAKRIIGRTKLPSKINYIGYRQQSLTTLEMNMDEGWSFTFRIHNASTIVEPSLKFDIQLLGIPRSILDARVVMRWKRNG